jgi:hypothetical protein
MSDFKCGFCGGAAFAVGSRINGKEKSAVFCPSCRMIVLREGGNAISDAANDWKDIQKIVKVVLADAATA